MADNLYSTLAASHVDEHDEVWRKVREGILEYCRQHHKFGFDPSNPVVRLHEPTFSGEEIIAALEVLLSTRVTMGPKVKAFERQFAQSGGFAHAISNNSGSSANLLAVAALTNPAWEGHLRPGDEVIVPALSWSTTIWPLIQHNLVPVIVDIDPATWNIDPNEVERAISPRTRAIMPVHVYGNPCDMRALLDICQRHELLLIEDCCEALGGFYEGTPVGRFGKVGTFSFYFSHHITTLEGGICVTGDFELAEMMRILRAHGWTRELESREKYTNKYPEFDPRFLFVNLGYNLRMTELQGAMGTVQLPKLAGFVDQRRETSATWQKDWSEWGDVFQFQKETRGGRSSAFGFPLLVNQAAPFTVREITSALNAAAIETRPVICGNIAKQPAMQLYAHRVSGTLAHATRVMEYGFSIGNHQAVDAGARAYVTGTIAEFMSRKGR
jgi:CDP-6-deoxy-D-xylo-4-hexulose-3-dehydrase